MIKDYKLFTDIECDEIIEWIESDSQNWEVYNFKRKKCKRKLFGKNILYYNRIKEKVKQILEIDADSEVGVLKYEKGDYFSPHIDSTSDGFHDDWIWNVNIQLTNPNDYTGGELIHKNQSYKMQKGNLYFYNSNELHGVNEVTNGLRYCIVFYIKKNDFKKQKQLI